MSPLSIGLIGLVLGIISLFSSVSIELFGLPRIFLFTEIIPLIISVVAVYLGVLVRKGNTRILGVIIIALGVIGTLSHLLRLIGFGR